MSFKTKIFFDIHKAFVVKTIEELYFEEVLNLKTKDDMHFSLNLDNNIHYLFSASLGIWDNIHIDKKSFQKIKDNELVKEFTIDELLKEIQIICNMSDDTLAKYIEEANQTVFSDLKLYANYSELDMDEFIEQKYHLIDQVLPGHPKLIMNKGRIGWGQSEISRYAPEFRGKFPLVWIAVSNDIVQSGFESTDFNLNIATKSLGAKAIASFNPEEYTFMAVHPWQWDRYIKTQYAKEIFTNKIVKIDDSSDFYSPQVSIRTLTRLGENNAFDIKLSLSILNTSCVRGIPNKFIKDGHLISKYMEDLIAKDEFLKDKVLVLKEVGAVSVKKSVYESIVNCSYRYKELLGCIWRESVDSKLLEDESAIPTAALFFKTSGKSFIESLVAKSSLDIESWMIKYFEVIVLPLYHLQVKHGLGLVSHGQNIILVLRNNIPSKLIIKDFHGDLRIANNSIHKESREFQVLDQLAPEYLIHDLITGHFVTVLRYISRILKDSNLIDEIKFYDLLGSVVNKFNSNKKIPDNINLLKKDFEKILVNKIRFIAGYDETNLRLKPELGNLIKNPLRVVGNYE